MTTPRDRAARLLKEATESAISPVADQISYIARTNGFTLGEAINAAYKAGQEDNAREYAARIERALHRMDFPEDKWIDK